MRPHVGAKTLARYRQGDLSQRRSSRIGAHLAGCARCRARSEDLAGVTALLASVRPPPMPEHLAARIQAALATEAATQVTRSAEKAPAGEKAAAGAPTPAGTGPAANGRRPRPEAPGHGRRPRLARPGPAVALRALTAAAAVVILAGGIYGLTRLGASSTSSGSAAAPAVPTPASQSVPGGITAIRSGTDYTPGNLSRQVAAQLARHGHSPAVAGPNAGAPGGHRVVDAGLLGLVEVRDVGFDAVNQSSDPSDFLVGRGGVGAGPVVDPVDGGGQSFPGAQQIVEVGLQVGQERDVGAEVIAADAAEPDRAGSAAGFDVGRFGACAVGDGDLADGVAGAFGFQQQVRVTPDPVAVPVETERGDPVDGRAATVFTDAVVAPGHGIAAVIEQFGQHVDGDTGIGVALGVAVPCLRRDRVRSGSCCI